MNTSVEPEYCLKVGSGIGLIIFGVAGGLLADLSKLENGEYGYNPLTVPLAIELSKASISALLAGCTKTRNTVTACISPKEYLLYAVPAACYFATNSCMFLIIRDLGVTQFQILSTTKVLFTALFMRVFLGRRLHSKQVAALALLALGLISTQVRTRLIYHPRASFRGYLLVVMTSVASSVGGVYNETLLKRDTGHSLHLKNIVLYSWGVAFSLLASWLTSSALDVQHSLFAGYSPIVYVMIFTLSLSGLSVSLLLKYADSLIKSMVAALVIALTACLQVLRGSEELSFSLIFGIFLISASLRMYALPNSQHRQRRFLSYNKTYDIGPGEWSDSPGRDRTQHTCGKNDLRG